MSAEQPRNETQRTLLRSVFRAAQIPNWICVIRFLLIAPILYYLSIGRFPLALALIAIAGVSDALDGYLAKRFNWESRLGGFLDPLADKFLLVTVFILLTHQGFMPLWLTCVVIGRDLVIVTGGFAYQWLIGEVYAKPTFISKANTFLQLVFSIGIVAQQAFGWPGELVLLIAGTGVFVASLVSGLDYIWTWGRLAIRNRHASRTYGSIEPR